MEFEVERGGDVRNWDSVRKGDLMLRPMLLPPASWAPRLAASMIPGATAGGDHETAAAGGDLNGPFGEHVGEAARVFVVAGHVDGGAGALQIRFLVSGGDFLRRSFLMAVRFFLAASPSLEARGSRKKTTVSWILLAAKAGERFLIFREDAQNASIGAVDELWVS